MTMKPTAVEFVPKLYAPSQTIEVVVDKSNEIQSSLNGLNSSAEAWVPYNVSPKSRATTAATSSPLNSNLVGDNGSTENMVEVTWNGSTFFVPESMAYAYEDNENPDEDIADIAVAEEPEIGLDWSNGSSTFPAPPKRSLQTLGIPEPIRQHFQALDIEALRQMPADDEKYKELPPRYHSAYSLDDEMAPRGTGGSFGYPSALYKVVDQTDSQLYALRRFDNVRSSPTVIDTVTKKWLEIRHPAIVSLYGISQERGAVFFAHAYHPMAQTLKQRFLGQEG